VTGKGSHQKAGSPLVASPAPGVRKHRAHAEDGLVDIRHRDSGVWSLEGTVAQHHLQVHRQSAGDLEKPLEFLVGLVRLCDKVKVAIAQVHYHRKQISVTMIYLKTRKRESR